MSRIVVDYEELHRLARVWFTASEALAAQALQVAALAADPVLAANAVFDPAGAARLELRLLATISGARGISRLSFELAADAARLESVVVKERLVDGFPIRQLLRLGGWLALAPVRLAAAPAATIRDGEHRAGAVADAMVEYLAPSTETILALVAPSSRFKADVATGRPLQVDPIFGLPLAEINAVAPEGPGAISVSRWAPPWADEPPGTLAAMMSRIADLENAPDASLAVQQVVGADGVRRFVVELPGMRHVGVAADPLDLSGAISAMAVGATSYTRCVRDALDAAGVPAGAEVALVGHSQGGIVAMDLAADPAFNGQRVRVTHVVVAGSPISSMRAEPPTRVLSVENVSDIVTHLDAVRSPVPLAVSPQGEGLLTYQFADDRQTTLRTHAPQLYAAHLEQLDGSPNPLLRDFLSGLRPYRSGTTTTTIFELHDRAPG